MEKELIELANKKKAKKQELYKLKAQYLKTIYIDFIHKKSAKQVASDLYDLTIKKKKEVFDPIMFANAIKVSQSIEKKLPSEKMLQTVAKRQYPAYKNEINDDSIALAILVFGLFDGKVHKKLTTNITTIINDYETDEKDDIIETILKDNEGLKVPKVMYLASSHNDCAEDHVDFQGKLYYDKNYKQVLKVLDDADSVISDLEAFIRANNLMSMQEVISKPNWFITRPNCRHFFIPLYAEEVLEHSVGDLTRRYHAHRKVGDRAYLQTMRSGKQRKLVGEKRNAELMIEKYKTRLDEHKELYKTFKSGLIKRAIEKDNLLISRWTEYLKKFE